MRGDDFQSINKTENKFTKGGKVDLNDLMRKVRDEEKKTKRSNVAISAAVLSAVAVFGVILTL